MASLDDKSLFEDIFRLENDTPAEAIGPEGDISYANIQAQQLANRTRWLRSQLVSLNDFREYTFFQTEEDPDGTIAGLANTPEGKLFRVSMGDGDNLAFKYYLKKNGVAVPDTSLIGRGSITNSVRLFSEKSEALKDALAGNILDGSKCLILSEYNSIFADEYINDAGILIPTGMQLATPGYTDTVINSLKSSGLIAEVMDPKTGYSLAFRDPASKRSCFHVTVTGEVEIPLLQHQDGSIERPALQEDIQRLIPTALDPASGYVLAWIDPVTRHVALRVSVNGQVDIPLLKITEGSIERSALHEEMQSLIPVTLDPATGYIMAWIDPVTRHIALRVSVSGEVDIPLLKIAEGAIEPEMLSPNLQGLVPVYLTPDSGYVLAWMDPATRRIALRVTVTGQVEIPLLAIGKEVITADNLTDELRGSLMPVAQDVVSVYPDAVRSRIAEITARTNDKDGSGWSQLSSHICRALYGINNTGVSVEYRRSFGLKVVGKAQGAPYDPGTVPSTNRRGRLTSTTITTPAGSFSAGDYYSYEAYNTNSSVSETAPGNWNGQNVYLGDLLVYDGTSWSIQRSPGSGAARKNGTWYLVTSAGTFAGMTLVPGDAVLFLTLQTAGGGFLQPQFAVLNTSSDLLLYGGEFSPTAGYPVSDRPNVVYQASASGSSGGESYIAGDYAMFDGVSWVRIANDEAVTVPAGKSISLRCAANADEWEFRRADKAATSVAVRMKAQVATAMRQGLCQKLLLIGDSMFGSGSSGTTILTATGRTGEVRSYGGSTSDQVVGMVLQEILSWGDRWAGQTIVPWHGQNNQPTTDLGAAQVREASLKLHALAGPMFIRLLFLTVMGQRQATWNGSRMVYTQHENQFARTGALYELTEWYRRVFPEQHAVVYEIMLSAATDAIDPTFPGMTEKQVAAQFGVLPWSFFNNSVLPGGMTTSDIHYVGTWSTSGLPSGGNHADYYLRIAGGTVGNVLVNNGGTWSEVAIDITHMSQAGGQALAFGGEGFILGDGYKSIPAREGIVGILLNNYFFK
ncbi:hypothetical protein [Klebsiella quasipneumoniae]|uniref:hypothetical protein n=1 Tax=Klebsiella quasipneumoniae TaxID=1463165 RepID=UPI002181AAFC|nr:hypothetical protein [Klebsiella quasipneumoniae]GKQ10539.1 hypothetical protein NUKP79_42600 [Klebsiella quasipneumoniae]HCI8784966.1 hypothetical protein [Klebsiella quasipneumoniae]